MTVWDDRDLANQDHPADAWWIEHDDTLAAQDRDDERSDKLSQFPHTGDEATTTVEARGCPSPMPGCREHNPAGDAGRAAEAHLIGQRQDGPSQVPARAQYPRVAHGDAGSSSEAFARASLALCLPVGAAPPASSSHAGGPSEGHTDRQTKNLTDERRARDELYGTRSGTVTHQGARSTHLRVVQSDLAFGQTLAEWRARKHTAAPPDEAA